MPLMPFTVEAEAPGTKARAARFTTAHGEVFTPAFMPVATMAAMRALPIEYMKEVGAPVLLGNTYHLMLRPGAAVFDRVGGIHRFMNWDGPVLTDSGGFQIFSLPKARVMGEDGARFQSYVDGREYLLSPETSIAMQRSIGSDIMMVLDQCIPSTSPREVAVAAMELTHRWATRSLEARGDSKQALFAIVQGACHLDLREKSAACLTKMPFDGFAIGGLAVGESAAERSAVTGLVTGFLPTDRPRYLMGVGTPIDLLEAVHRGVDMFDCIIPSQVAWRGTAFTSKGRLYFRRTVYQFDEGPLDPDCSCRACRGYSKAYLHHLIKTDQTLGGQLLSLHNFTFYRKLMDRLRGLVVAGTFADHYPRLQKELTTLDDENPMHPTAPKRRKSGAANRLGDFEVLESPNGYSSIRQVSSGETMHPMGDPNDEATKLYVEQSALARRLATGGLEDAPLVIWDVGLGAATNAMAVIRCYEDLLKAKETTPRALTLVSFEKDLDPLRLVLKDAPRFAHIRHGAPYELHAKGTWQHPRAPLKWQLKEGDFLEYFPTLPAPDLIYYDPFSLHTDGPLWEKSCFEKIHNHLRGKNTELYTYSCSTAVRVSLLVAGWAVGEGAATGVKTSTTLAFSKLEGAGLHPDQPALLGKTWLGRWQRSHTKHGGARGAEEQARVEGLVLGHPQFQGG